MALDGSRVLIFGRGFMGSLFALKIPGARYADADITHPGSVAAALASSDPLIAINCAGRTGRPNIDWCEEHKIETLASNTLGPLVLARECLQRGIFMAHIGSGCVYQGDNGGRGWSEEDPPNFFGSMYSRSKILSEAALKELPVLQLRLRMPISSIPVHRNLLTKLLWYPKIISVPNSITVLEDFVAASLRLIELRRTGIYNVTNPGAIEHPEILELYRRIANPILKYEVISLEEFSRMVVAKRSNCVLNTDKLASEGIALPSIREALPKLIAEYAEKAYVERPYWPSPPSYRLESE